ncbi:MAG: DUF2207 domain-containing protein [Patescibacteria group bacterium]|nr:DUF2207 domain-containing protein [Patescibacteria group bacterium]
MKKIYALLVVLSLFVLPAAASAAEVINDFAVQVTSDQSRRLIFEETIAYDFGDAVRHGIYRYIPEVFDRDRSKYNYRLEVLGVLRDGQEEPYSVSRSSGQVNIKIGDADKTITGRHTYAIRYTTDRALNFFDDHDELYWNVTGNGWSVPIERASISFVYPAGVSVDSVKTDCFTGVYGSTEKACRLEERANGSVFSATRLLDEYEGMTVVYGFPVSTFPKPTMAEKIWMLIRDNAAVFFPLAALLVMAWLWYTKGRDPKLNTIIPEYEAPQNLTPALIGSAMTNGTVPDRAMTATIIDLARRGFLKIEFGEKKGLFKDAQTFTFVKQKTSDESLADYEKTVLDGLFKDGERQSVDDLKDGKFYTSVTKFKTQVAAAINKMGLFDANPVSVRLVHIVVAFIVAGGLFVFFSDTALGTFCAFLTGLIIAVFGWFMPRRTAQGIQLLTDINGFKWFLSVTEKDRMDFHNAPERTPEQFQALLPFAIVFGVENKWAAQFASMNIPPPDWATGNTSSLNAVMLASSLNSMHSTASAAAFSPPSSAGSGGSGFSGGGSGGGGGGGGGGSW